VGHVDIAGFLLFTLITCSCV